MEASEIIGVIDCETTGVSARDEPITISLIVAKIDKKGNAVISNKWTGRQFPSVEISDGAYRVHGISRESLQGSSFDKNSLRQELRKCDYLIAHNATFDARMIGKVVPDIKQMEWRCSYRQWVWPEMENKKLDTVCTHFGIPRMEKHDSMNDCLVLLQALTKHSGKTERSSTYLRKLIGKRSFEIPMTYEESELRIRRAIQVVYQFDEIKQQEDKPKSHESRRAKVEAAITLATLLAMLIALFMTAYIRP